MASKSVLLEKLPNGIAIITMNRPKSLNALNAALLSELVDALRQSIRARVIVIQGAGDRAFCAGEDLKESLTPHTGSAEELWEAFYKLQDLTRLMSSSPALVVAAVNGWAVGGGAEIALAADFVVGSPVAKFRFPEVVIGHAITGGISQRLPLLVGLLKAKELFLTGRDVAAEEALQIGMMSEIASDAKARALELAHQLAKLPQTSASCLKMSVERAVFPNQEAVLQDEIHVASLCFAQRDAEKAFSNFAARKSKPASSPPADLNTALAQAVRTHPEKTFLRVGGNDYTFQAFDQAVARMAGSLRSQGVQAGDRVLVMMRNSIEMLHTWFSTNRLGAVWAPINPELRSTTLKHVIESAGPKIAFVDPDLVDIVQGGEVLKASEIFSVQASPPTSSVLPTGAEPITEAAPVSAATTSALLFTSGSTGRSKACILSHGYFIETAGALIENLGLNSSDVLYTPFPLFHIDATALTAVPALLLGGVAAVSMRYSASKFWTEIRETKATVYDFMGATLALTYKQPPSPHDRDHSVRVAWGCPVPSWASDYESRFGHPLAEVYGSCEAGVAAMSSKRTRVPGSCGRAVKGYTLRVVDDVGNCLSPNTEGNLLVRSDRPHSIFRGYFGNPVATVETLSDAWLHTGDRAKIDADGNLFYIGRTKDVIRRRGENVNAFEIEEELVAHPAVKTAAAFAIPSQLGQGTEDDIKVAVVLQDGAAQTQTRDFDEHALWQWTVQNMAKFQVPDVIEFVDHLQTTSTGKIEKWRLKKDGGMRFGRRAEANTGAPSGNITSSNASV